MGELGLLGGLVPVEHGDARLDYIYAKERKQFGRALGSVQLVQTVTQTEAQVQPVPMADNLGREAVVLVAVGS
jgi:hypothetical protein